MDLQTTLSASVGTGPRSRPARRPADLAGEFDEHDEFDA
jgi:hypothetical protein